jgi:hypothetical protein
MTLPPSRNQVSHANQCSIKRYEIEILQPHRFFCSGNILDNSEMKLQLAGWWVYFVQEYFGMSLASSHASPYEVFDCGWVGIHPKGGIDDSNPA